MGIEVWIAVTFEKYLLKEIWGSLRNAAAVLHLDLSFYILKMGSLKCTWVILIIEEKKKKDFSGSPVV